MCVALEVSELNSVYRSPLHPHPHPHPHLTLPLCWCAAFAEEEAAYVSASATRIQRKRYASRAPLSTPASLFQAPPQPPTTATTKSMPPKKNVKASPCGSHVCFRASKNLGKLLLCASLLAASSLHLCSY